MEADGLRERGLKKGNSTRPPAVRSPRRKGEGFTPLSPPDEVDPAVHLRPRGPATQTHNKDKTEALKQERKLLDKTETETETRRPEQGRG